ncbi:probable LRR receptor-like serine/threonine-protein kinase At3g47570 [Solanum dulcamara]|uniref:probable LRR receptor-like serine/threonine-protein kinase At3g47570 n=1 Tax=Solanum dulcamara TaxID=45834 RepID=UPI0024863739|nr:probable LRR receptor-like serine/threonine-protein kinase At3g47570 [Solanum dulcamara]
MVFYQIVFSVLLVWFSLSTRATNSTQCDQHCGAGSIVPYPFGFSEGCVIRLNCSTGDIRFGEYLIQNVTSDTLMVNFPVNCSRPIEDLQQFVGTSYGMTWRNVLLLQNCKVPRSECPLPRWSEELLSARLNIQTCDSKKENVSCYSEVSADYLDYKNTGCGIVVSSIMIGKDNDRKNSSVMFLEFQTIELEWGLEGDCACHEDANCTNIFLPGNRNGFRCRCKDGFIGDGFRHGDGCREEPSKTKHLDSRVLLAVVPVALSVLVLCSYGAYYKLSNSRKTHPWNDGKLAQTPRTTYREILGATDGFSEDNLVGIGSFGSVYKAHFRGENTIMAVKVLNLQQRGALRSFLDECRALRNIRHRNLLKIKTACSSIDHQGNDFKCLVFEFMTNGNLHDWLHSENDDQKHQTKKLTFIQRLNIAIDVASALDYLHNHCQTPIVHCDLKPSNILLDEDMSAHVGDFGLATFLLDTSSNSWSYQISAALKGSIGYIPTEYGSGGQASTHGDVYSFGIVLLELFICRRPTDVMFHENLNIHKYVSMALPEHVMEIIDPILLLDEEEQNINEDQPTRMEECLVSVLEIGLKCSASSPKERIPINTVLSKLQAIKKSVLLFFS